MCKRQHTFYSVFMNCPGKANSQQWKSDQLFSGASGVAWSWRLGDDGLTVNKIFGGAGEVLKLGCGDGHTTP